MAVGADAISPRTATALGVHDRKDSCSLLSHFATSIGGHHEERSVSSRENRSDTLSNCPFGKCVGRLVLPLEL